MRNGKATFVTLLMAVMLIVIEVGLYTIWNTGFLIIAGILAVYGFIHGAFDFRSWLRNEPDPAILPVFEDDILTEEEKAYWQGVSEQSEYWQEVNKQCLPQKTT